MQAITPPPIQWRGIDTAGDDSAEGYVITPERARSLREQGIWWVARYLRLSDDPLPRRVAGGDHAGCYSLSLEEMDAIVGVGLGLVPVQWGSSGRDVLGRDLGWARGELAIDQARALGIPDGVHLWCDLEGRAAARAGMGACQRYVAAWARVVTMRGYRAGLYVGDPGVPLTASQLYGIPHVTSYWRAATRGGPPAPYPRGWSIVQGRPTTVAGIRCDTDILGPDWLGEVPVIAGTAELDTSLRAQAIVTIGAH